MLQTKDTIGGKEPTLMASTSFESLLLSLGQLWKRREGGKEGANDTEYKDSVSQPMRIQNPRPLLTMKLVKSS